jgi:hypothetical protein
MAPNPWCLGYALFCFVLLGLTHMPTTLSACPSLLLHHRFKNTHQITTVSGSCLLTLVPTGLGTLVQY